MPGWTAMRSMSQRSDVVRRSLTPGTTRRVLGYARPFLKPIIVLLVLVTAEAFVMVAAPLLLKDIVDLGVTPRDAGVVIGLSLLVALLALFDAGLSVLQRWYSSQVGEGVICDLRIRVFGHVLRQPIAFFTRTQTGSLVSRLNSDVIDAQTAFTSVLSGVVSNVVSLVLILAAMLALSWELTVGALLLVPFFLLAAHVMGGRLAGLSMLYMNLNADMGSRMTERFNVAGALLVKLFGDVTREDREYAGRAASVRDTGVRIELNRTVLMVAFGLVAALASAVIYGFGGVMAVNGSLTVGTLLALAALLARLYAPLTSISNVRVDIMTALVSFERIFEVLDLKPLVTEKVGAQRLPDGPLRVDFEHVSFRYPSADEVSLASLEATSTGDRGMSEVVLHDVCITVEPGQMVALVGPSGAGKTTIAALVARLYDPVSGSVRVGGTDLRDTTLASLHGAVGVVTQEAHLFHDTIRANLDYAQPNATEEEMRAALGAAQVLRLVDRLPEGLDTVVGDRGHRLSGGEKQRLAIARLLLKAPRVIVLDEATAHLDSGSEAAVQGALDVAMAGRTSLVIAHRLSTVRGADQILVIDNGRIVERGRHAELLAHRGLYADLYETQFAEIKAAASDPI